MADAWVATCWMVAFREARKTSSVLSTAFVLDSAVFAQRNCVFELVFLTFFLLRDPITGKEMYMSRESKRERKGPRTSASRNTRSAVHPSVDTPCVSGLATQQEDG